MDYAHQRRLKIFGRLRIVDASEDPDLATNLAVPGYAGRVERAVLVTVEAFDWNCPQHITPRFTQSELEQTLAPVRETITSLRAENERLHRLLDERAEALITAERHERYVRFRDHSRVS